MTENKIKGLLGAKLGMTQVFDSRNQVVPVTVVKVGSNTVIDIRTPQRDGYNAVVLAFEPVSEKKVTKPVAGQFAKANVAPHRYVAEIRTSDTGEYSIGQKLDASVFSVGDFVDVTGISKGKGFTGTMKRHGFGGLGASHGAHRVHRSPGSIGGCSTPGRVFRGLRMSGRHGNKTITTQNLVVHSIDATHGVLLIKGALPGVNGSLVTVKTAAKGGVHA